MTFLIISYFAPHVTLFNMVQTSVHAYCDGHSPFCNYFFNCTSRAIIDIWITFLKSFTVYWRNIFAWMSYVIKKVLGNVEIKIKKGVKQCCRNFLWCHRMCIFYVYVQTYGFHWDCRRHKYELMNQHWCHRLHQRCYQNNYLQIWLPLQIHVVQNFWCFFNLFYLFGFCFWFFKSGSIQHKTLLNQT